MTTELLNLANNGLKALRSAIGSLRRLDIQITVNADLITQIDAALAQPADDDAWLKRLWTLVDEYSDAKTGAAINGSESHYRMVSVMGETLNAHLRTRPARDGFVPVPVEPICYAVITATEGVDYTAPATSMCHDHINSVLMCDDIDEDYRNEYKTARVIPLYAAAKGDGK